MRGRKDCRNSMADESEGNESLLSAELEAYASRGLESRLITPSVKCSLRGLMITVSSNPGIEGLDDNSEAVNCEAIARNDSCVP